MKEYENNLKEIKKEKVQQESSIGHNWEDVREELFTPEEIAESDFRVAQVEELERCSEEGKACEYGICSECPKCFMA